MAKSTRRHVPCWICGNAHTNPASSSTCSDCGPIYAIDNMARKAALRKAEKEAALLFLQSNEESTMTSSMPVQLPNTGPYSSKDQLKANCANKFIGRGSSNSSTNKYRIAYGDLANCGDYTESDMVFVSVEGARRGRVPLDNAEVLLAIKAGAAIIADTAYNRNRPYNIGERELADLLTANDYVPIDHADGACWEHY